MNTTQKKEKIEKVAFKLFLDKGYSETSIRNICVKANIEAPTLYYYYGSKKGLFFKIAEGLLEDFLATNSYMSNTDIQQDAERALYNIFCSIVDFATKHSDKTRFYLRYALFAPSELSKEIDVFLNNISDKLYQAVCLHITSCKSQGLISLEADVATKYTIKFINSNTFDIVFSGWIPTSTELEELWQDFFGCRLRGVK